jgi:SOS-response transcriptional repressor LexA
MRELTTRQRDVLNFMRAFTARHGVPPTVREIGEKFRVTPRAAFDHLRALERKGMLQRRSGPGRTARALTLSEAAGAGRRASAFPSWAASPPAARCSPRRIARASYRSPPVRCPAHPRITSRFGFGARA